LIILPGVEDVLEALSGKYRLVVATKGDLLDQERKLKSGLERYFHHIEIMSDKQESDYLKLIRHLDIDPKHFMMIGTSSNLIFYLSCMWVGMESMCPFIRLGPMSKSRMRFATNAFAKWGISEMS
jgi:FMN phosphatase YigB (HAD superfamily)